MRFLRVTALLVVLAIIGCQLNSNRRTLPTYKEVPKFVLTDEDGKEFDSDSLKGKVWTLNFFFTSCPEVCPAVNGRLSSIEHQFETDRNVRFISISIDPETDTPAILNSYKARFAASPESWKFLTGSKSDINTLMDTLSLGAPVTIDAHSSRILLIDSDMKVRGYYLGNENEVVEKLTSDIKLLAN